MDPNNSKEEIEENEIVSKDEENSKITYFI